MSTIAPWLSVKDATEAVDFYRAAFGAVDSDRLEDDAGGVIVARLSIDGADFWVQHDPDSSPDAINRMSVRMILTVEDPDSVLARAVAAGATEITPISEDHGWRIGRDRRSLRASLGDRQADLELRRAAFAPRGAIASRRVS
jgi:PhnB protein